MDRLEPQSWPQQMKYANAAAKGKVDLAVKAEASAPLLSLRAKEHQSPSCEEHLQVWTSQAPPENAALSLLKGVQTAFQSASKERLNIISQKLLPALWDKSARSRNADIK